MSKKGMRLVAMIEEKKDGQYEVINFLPDIKIKHQDENDRTQPNFIADDSQKEDYIQIPYAQGINDLTVIVGENGVGKTRLVNDIFSLDEKKLFVFKNLDEIDPIYKGKHTYYNFHALNESSQGNNEWKLSFDGARLTEWDYEDECIKAEYWGEEEVSEKEEYTEWFTRKVAIVKLSNAVESASPRGMGADLSTTRLLKDGNYNNLLLSDMDKQIKFLLSEFVNVKMIEELLKFSGKQLRLVLNDNFLEEELDRNQELQDDRSYLAELSYRMEKYHTLEEKIKFFLTDYLAQIYAEVKFNASSNDILDYVGILDNLDDIVIDDEVVDFLSEKIYEANQHEISENDYISHELGILRKAEINLHANLAAYKYKFYNFSLEKRIEEIKKAIRPESIEVIDQIDKLFNYSGKYNDAAFNLQSNVFLKSLHIVFDKTKERPHYFIKGGEKINQLLELQRDIIDNNNYLVINVNDSLSYSYILIRELINAFMFQWQGLSSGQLALLNLFGRLHSLSEGIKDKKSILLLLDEVDLGLHPEWQRKWISTALPIIGEIFKGKHVQIIMTTHSPIMLSDIYQENVIFLGKDDNGERIVKGNGDLSETFGQNIHDLYRQSFFLGSTRGQYATETIDHVIKSLYQLEYWQKEDNRKQEIYEELKWNNFREKILMPSGEDYDEEIVKPLLRIDNFDQYSGVFSNDDDDAKIAYESLFEVLYPTKQLRNNKKNYTQTFETSFATIKPILKKIKEEAYQLETIEGLKDIIDEQYKDKKKENFIQIREQSWKKLSSRPRDEFSNQKFRDVLEKVINAIGERLIRNKLRSVFETIDFYLENHVPMIQVVDVNDLINDLDDGQKRELLEKLRQELEEKDSQ